jgi:hypothetical protein
MQPAAARTAAMTWGWKETTMTMERGGEGSVGRRVTSLDPASCHTSVARVEEEDSPQCCGLTPASEEGSDAAMATGRPAPRVRSADEWT